MRITITFFISFIFLMACTSEPTNKQQEEKSSSIRKEEDIKWKEAEVEIDTSEQDTSKPVEKVEKPSIDPPNIQFKTLAYAFDTITAGEVITHPFEFTNIGGKPLEISKVQGSCGCTAASYPFLPFTAGESDSVTARFDSKNKKGPQENTLTVISTAENSPVVLKITGYVKEKADE